VRPLLQERALVSQLSFDQAVTVAWTAGRPTSSAVDSTLGTYSLLE